MRVSPYFIVDAVKGIASPQIHHALLASTNKQKSDSKVAVILGGGDSCVRIPYWINDF